MLDPRVTFTRESPATYFDADGLLRYANHNQARSSQNFSSTSWVKYSGATVTADDTIAPDGTTTADRLNHVTAGTVVGGYIAQDIEPPAYQAIMSVYAKAGSKNFLVIATSAALGNSAWFDLAAGTAGTWSPLVFASSGIESIGDGWYRCWAVTLYPHPPTLRFYLRVGETDLSINCTSPGNIFIWGAQYQYVTTETSPGAYLPTLVEFTGAGGPRFDYHPITHEAKGLLVEPAMTNLLRQSQHGSNAIWTKSGATVLADQMTAPDGTLTGDLFTADASPATTSQAPFNVPNGTRYVQSIFVKKGTANWFWISGRITGTGAADPKAWFNLNTGTVGTVQTGIDAVTVQDVGSGWYRCSISRLGTAGVEVMALGPCDADGSTAVAVGTTMYVWGAQVEIVPASAAAPTSYLPVPEDSPTTRNAEVAVMTGSNFSSWFNAGPGTFVADYDLFDASGTRAVLSADFGITQDSIRLLNSGTDPKAVLVRIGAPQADLDLGTVAANELAKIAISYAPNDVSGCFNGGTVVTDTSAILSLPDTINQLCIGSTPAGNYCTGHVRRIRFYNVAKSDPQIIALTTIGAVMPVGTLVAIEGADIAAAAGGFAGALVATDGADIAAGIGGFAGATLNGPPSNTTLSNGNLTVVPVVIAATGGARSLTNKSTGKYYFEVTVNVGASTADVVGVATAGATYVNAVTNGTNGCYLYITSAGAIWSNNANTGKALGSIAVSGTVIGISIDQDNHRGWFKKVSGTPGNWNGDGAANPATNTGGVTIASAGMEPIYGRVAATTARQYTFNFGATAFTGPVPSGFTAGWPT